MRLKITRKKVRVPTDVAGAMAARGFFPETLPPCFTSASLAGFWMSQKAAIDAARYMKRMPAKLIPYSSTKNTGSRRTFSTPHPLTYLFICRFIDEHLPQLESFYKTHTTISASRPEFQISEGIRSVKITSFGELDLVVHKALKHAPYLLKTDIAQFYLSIYTHSIPWAYHSRRISKKDRDVRSKKVFFNELDYHLRNCQDGQTHGLFVGPDAARIISELILAAVDKEFLARTKKKVIGAVRYVDDYYIGVESEADAAQVLTVLDRELSHFELALNDTKTKVVPTSEPGDALWPLELNRLANELLGEDASEAHLAELFNAALKLASTFKSQSPIKLLLRQVDKHNLGRQPEYEFIEPYLLRFVHHFAHAIDYVCMIVGARVLYELPIDTAAWTEVIENEVGRYARLDRHHEVAWLLWLSIVANLTIRKSTVEAIIRMENAHLSAMVVAALNTGRINHKVSLGIPAQLDMKSDGWLLYHETTVAGLSKVKSLNNDELDLNATIAGAGQSFIDYSIGEQRLKTGTSAIDGIRFGYELDEEVILESSDGGGRAGIFRPSTQDF